jgi:hypothetical protein
VKAVLTVIRNRGMQGRISRTNRCDLATFVTVRLYLIDIYSSYKIACKVATQKDAILDAILNNVNPVNNLQTVRRSRSQDCNVKPPARSPLFRISHVYSEIAYSPELAIHFRAFIAYWKHDQHYHQGVCLPQSEWAGAA